MTNKPTEQKVQKQSCTYSHIGFMTKVTLQRSVRKDIAYDKCH